MNMVRPGALNTFLSILRSKPLLPAKNMLMGVFTHDQIMVGLENGDVYILGILSDEIADPARRLKKKIVLDKGVPVSSYVQNGFWL